MADHPLVNVGVTLPVLTKANALRRRVQGRVASFDLIQWDKVAYGEREQQDVHIWEMNDLCPRDGWPTVLLVHGGGWREGSWQDFESFAPQLSRRGLMVAAMNYRLAPDHSWPAPLEDVLAAVDFLRSQLTDPSRIALWGHSAGGHLAIMAAMARPEWIRSVVAVGAPTDLAQLHPDETDGIFDADDLLAASPLHSESPGSAPPVLLVHGEHDRVCPIESARQYAATRQHVELLEVPEGDHGVRWPPLGALRTRRRAVSWLLDRMDMPERGSKWRRRKKGAR